MSSARRIVLFFGAAIVLGILLLLGINSFLAWQAQSKFDARLAAIRAAGEPATLSDLTSATLQRDQNAAAILKQVDGDLATFWKEFLAYEMTGPGESWDQSVQSGRLPAPDQVASVEQILDSHQPILAAIRSAAACEAYASMADFKAVANQDQFIGQIGPALQRSRSIANFADAKMITLAAEGKLDEAVVLGIQMLRLARHYDNEPAIINFLVAVAVREITFQGLNFALQSGSVNADVRAQLEAELAQHDNLGPLQHAMVTERAYAITNIDDQTSGFARMLGWPAMNWMLGQMNLLDRAVAASKLSPDELLPNRTVNARDSHKPGPLDGVAEDAQIGFSIMSAFNAEFRRLAETRALRVLNALGEYRDRTGKDADSLDQLSLPKSATIDPWTGKPLIIKKTEKGWVVYSVGQNSKDDGGRFEKMDDVGFGPPGYGCETNEKEEPDAKQP
jgi:hypothetical protein